MESLSEINLGNQILSIVVAAGLVAFGALVLRLFISGIKFFIKKVKINNANKAFKNKDIQD